MGQGCSGAIGSIESHKKYGVELVGERNGLGFAARCVDARAVRFTFALGSECTADYQARQTWLLANNGV